MSVYRRNAVYYYDFLFKGERYSGSTRLRNKVKADLFESKLKTDLAMGEVGLAVPKTAPRLKEFLEGKFLDHIRLQSANKPKTIRYYENSVARLIEYDGFKDVRLNLIDADLIEQFKQWRSKQKRRTHGAGLVGVTTINRELAGLRRALKLAYEWKLITKPPVLIRLLPGETKRDYVLSGEVERLYLTAAPSPLKEAAILMIDMGLRPEECVSIRKADISNGLLLIPAGKTPSARRTLPIPERSMKVIQFLSDFWPDSEWLFAGRYGEGKHLTVSGLEGIHRRVKAQTVDIDGNPVFPPQFDIYSLRHTFGTRLGESCGNPYTIMAAMGHASIAVSQRYVHPSRSQVAFAMKQLEAFNKALLAHDCDPVKA